MSCFLFSFSCVSYSSSLPPSPSSCSNQFLLPHHACNSTFNHCNFITVLKFLKQNSNSNVISEAILHRSSFSSNFLHPAFSSKDTSDRSFTASNSISDLLCEETPLSGEEIEKIISENNAIKSYSVDNLRARICSIRSIGIKDAVLGRLISECPNVLISPEVDSVIKCFNSGDISGEIDSLNIYQVLLRTNSGVLTDFAKKFKLLTGCGFSESQIHHVLNNVNIVKVICVKSTEEIKGILTFFHHHNCIDIILRWPAILQLDMDTQLIPKFDFLTKLNGGSEVESVDLLRKLPRMLRYSLRHMEAHAEFFRTFIGVTSEEVFKIMVAFPAILSVSASRKITPRLEFLRQCGLNSNEIFKYLVKSPLFLGLSFKTNLAHKIGMLMKIGYKHGTKDLATALGATTRTNCHNLQKVIDLFLRYGFGFDNLVVMSTRHPQMLQYTYDSLEEKIKYLVEDMGRNVEELISFPAYLGYNFKDRIKHRYELMKGLAGRDLSINSMFALSATSFMSRQEKNSI